MILFIFLFLPVLTSIFLWVKFRKKTTPLEFFIPLGLCLILIFISKLIVETHNLKSVEYWGSLIDKVEYYEDWNEYVHRTCSRSCCCDSKGQNCGTEYYDCSYVDYHPERFEITTTNGETESVNKKFYLYLKSLFGNSSFVDLGRNFYTNDGDKYFSKWDRSFEKNYPVTTIHFYENRVKKSKGSVFNFSEVDDSTKVFYDLKQYPERKDLQVQAVLGDDTAKYANSLLNYYNGLLGPEKEVRMFLLVFRNQPQIAAEYQRSYWKGANMNELVLAVNVGQDSTITWSSVISWTTNEKLKVLLEDEVRNKKYDPVSLVYTLSAFAKDFERRDFKEFSYITITPGTVSIIVTGILCLLVCIGSAFFIINNEIDNL